MTDESLPILVERPIQPRLAFLSVDEAEIAFDDAKYRALFIALTKQIINSLFRPGVLQANFKAVIDVGG